MYNVVGVKFKKNNKIYLFESNGVELHVGDYAIVETIRGVEFGKIYIANKDIENEKVIEPLKKVIRKATEEDKKNNEQNEIKEKEAFNTFREKIKEHKLDMKLVSCECIFDNSKLLFYFTAEGRIDFRELVKDIASIYKTRIELRQIGVRDEVKMLGEVGICGKELCCNTFLDDFESVSIKMAKQQGLSLNPTKISGLCGKLMCCIKYEQEVYAEKIKKMPKVNTVVETPEGRGIVNDIEILSGRVKVKLFKENDDIAYRTFEIKDINFDKNENN